MRSRETTRLAIVSKTRSEPARALSPSFLPAHPLAGQPAADRKGLSVASWKLRRREIPLTHQMNSGADVECVGRLRFDAETKKKKKRQHPMREDSCGKREEEQRLIPRRRRRYDYRAPTSPEEFPCALQSPMLLVPMPMPMLMMVMPGANETKAIKTAGVSIRAGGATLELKAFRFEY